MMKMLTQTALAATALAASVAGSANAASVSVIDTDTFTFNASYPITAVGSFDASAASKLVVTISSEDGFGDTLQSGVEFGGAPMTEAITDNDSIRNAWIYYLDASSVSGGFGTSDLVITGSGSNDFGGSLIALANTADGVGATNSASSDSVSIDTTVDGSIVVAAGTANGSTLLDSQSPLTQVFSDDVGSAVGASGYVITDPAVTGGSYEFDGAEVTAAAVFEPAAATVIPSPSALLMGAAGLGVVAVRRRRRAGQ